MTVSKHQLKAAIKPGIRKLELILGPVWWAIGLCFQIGIFCRGKMVEILVGKIVVNYGMFAMDTLK